MKYAGDVNPEQAYEALQKDPKAVLVDCRTKPEWSFVGVPTLEDAGKQVVFVEWVHYPDLDANDNFVDQVQKQVPDKDTPLYFICRSGQRSLAAAVAMTEAGYEKCFNVAEGFEGGHDDNQHRGSVAGWKVRGLPWCQP